MKISSVFRKEKRVSNKPQYIDQYNNRNFYDLRGPKK